MKTFYHPTNFPVKLIPWGKSNFKYVLSINLVKIYFQKKNSTLCTSIERQITSSKIPEKKWFKNLNILSSHSGSSMLCAVISLNIYTSFAARTAIGVHYEAKHLQKQKKCETFVGAQKKIQLCYCPPCTVLPRMTLLYLTAKVN